MNHLEKFFADATRNVEAKLDELIPSADIEPKNLHAAMRWSVFAGGKRFRPALCFAAGKTFGAAEENFLCAAAAIEMIHTYSLIHDDLPAMDDDDLRRGRETCHIKFGEATAILAGDQLQTLAFQSVAEDEKLTEKIRVKLTADLARAAARMVDGQQLDLEAEGKKISARELENIHRNKTGAMISAAARSGATVAGANENELNAVTIYAEKLGLLFQITDDLLDATQTTEVLGKTAGKDERAEKATYVSLYGLDKARVLAEETNAAAVGALRNVEKDTLLLENLADFILNRSK